MCNMAKIYRAWNKRSAHWFTLTRARFYDFSYLCYALLVTGWAFDYDICSTKAE